MSVFVVLQHQIQKDSKTLYVNMIDVVLLREMKNQEKLSNLFVFTESAHSIQS